MVKSKASSSSSSPSSSQKKKCVLILVGLPGSGKSFLSNLLENKGWARINQDTLGSAAECKKQLISAMKKQQNVILDRCNVLLKDRKMWIRDITSAAQESTKVNVNIECFFLNTAIDKCKQRAKERKNHPTLPAEKVDMVVHSFAKTLQPPELREGFQEVYIASNESEVKEQMNKLLKKYP